jgi:hypothetical protein
MRSLLPSLDAATGPEETPQVLGRHRDEYNVEYAELSMALDSVSVRDKRRMSQISPGDATVSVDGTYAGTVGQFNDPTHPLNLLVGQHGLGNAAFGTIITAGDPRIVPVRSQTRF